MNRAQAEVELHSRMKDLGLGEYFEHIEVVGLYPSIRYYLFDVLIMTWEYVPEKDGVISVEHEVYL